MSWALMRKRDVQLTPDDLERPGDDAREYAALRHNPCQLQWAVDRLQEREARERAREQEICSVRDQLSRSYEESASWRLMRPLWSGARLIRSLRRRESHSNLAC
jgi:hypothetical protein